MYYMDSVHESELVLNTSSDRFIVLMSYVEVHVLNILLCYDMFA